MSSQEFERNLNTPERYQRTKYVPGIVKTIDEAAFKLFGHRTGKFASGLRNHHVQEYGAWEEVRATTRQPKFKTSTGEPHKKSTGLEGWYAGFPPEDAVVSMLDIGTAALEYLTEKYGISYTSHFLKVLKGEVAFDPKVFKVARELFFAVRESAIEQTEQTKDVRDAFRAETKSLIQQTPVSMQIKSDAENRPVEYDIHLPQPKQSELAGDTADLTDLLKQFDNRQDKIAWDLLQTLGVVGYPYVRLAETTGLLEDIEIVMHDEYKHKPRTLSWLDYEWDGTIDVYKMMGYEGPRPGKDTKPDKKSK